MLPDDVLADLLASSGSGTGPVSRVFVDHRLRAMVSPVDDVECDELMLGRGPLQRLLARGLDDVLRTGVAATGYRVTPDAVVVDLADGGTVTGDAVVVAEGVHSPLSDQLLGGPTHRDLHAGAIGARVPGTADEHDLPDLAALMERHDAILGFGPRGLTLFLSGHRSSGGPPFDPAALDPAGPEIEEPFLVWSIIGADGLLPADAEPRERQRAVASMLRSWHPEIGRLVGRSDPELLTRHRFHAGTPVPTSPTTAVTVLGDAVHAVPPTGGIGASTALRDAGLLVDELVDVTDRPSLLRAFRRYEQAMRAYADDVVDRSVAPLRWQRAVRNPGVHAAVTGSLVVAHRVRRRVAR